MLEQLFQKRGGGTGGPSKKRIRNDDPSSESYLGPWGGYEEDKLVAEKLAKEASVASEAAEKQGKSENSGEATPVTSHQDTSATRSSVTFSESLEKHDWKGRSWTSAPQGSEKVPPAHVCSLPKKLVHTYKGHTNGVQTVKFFPKSGHLLLSASLDSTVKIWNYSGTRECMATYTGHSQGVRDIQFSNDGSKFFSAAFDTMIHYWDTERGKIISSFTRNELPFSIAVHPMDQQMCVVGMKNRRAVQYDFNSGKVIQEYNEHLGAISSVTFTENGRKLITTSDDRKIFIWNYGIPVVDHYISDPNMHAVPAVTVDPSGNFFAGQSMNNSIVVYEAHGAYRYQAKKRFSGHSSAGYAIQPGFSPDGKFIASGSSDGSVFFWDWKSSKLYRSMKAHEGVCMSVVWHPKQASRVLTAGWDSKIKLWE